MIRIGIDTSIASFDRDFDDVAWLQRLAQPADLR
jgi:predicted nucleic acid-binding protein